jgi:hypothetical protein
MRTLAVLIALLFVPCVNARAQEPDAPEGAQIASAQVSGFDFDRLSPGLRQSINALVGNPLNREALRQLAARIEAEHPDVVAAVRSVAAPNSEARVVFLVARISDDRQLGENINARYTIERVEIEGVPEANISQALRDDLQALVGSRLDPDQAEQLDKRLGAELPGYDVRRRMSRGSQPGRLRLVFDVSKSEGARWLRFAPSKSKLVYHSDQAWSGYLDIPLGGRDHRVRLDLPLGNHDDLIEEYSGYGVRVESRKVGTERLGVNLELSRFRQSWRPTTLSALEADPGIPEAYRIRSTVAPSLTFAVTPRVRVTAGVSVSELEPLERSSESQMANAAVASIGYDQRWRQQGTVASQAVEASFEWRAGTDTLQSDLAYNRYFGRGTYEHDPGRRDIKVIATGSMGHITGTAPLFERFSLGDSSSLRGWNKFDIAPAGGERMLHTSLEFRSHGFALFVDAGSVWDRDTDSRLRVSTGFGLHHDKVFMTLGFPLNTDHLSAAFTAGIRF